MENMFQSSSLVEECFSSQADSAAKLLPHSSLFRKKFYLLQRYPTSACFISLVDASLRGQKSQTREFIGLSTIKVTKEANLNAIETTPLDGEVLSIFIILKKQLITKML
ncbi:hypothetical protein L1887_22526 [Cichorium endivia]|nr:hypothetical protein L1887_22526 [Cichorium endivia]